MGSSQCLNLSPSRSVQKLGDEAQVLKKTDLFSIQQLWHFGKPSRAAAQQPWHQRPPRPQAKLASPESHTFGVPVPRWHRAACHGKWMEQIDTYSKFRQVLGASFFLSFLVAFEVPRILNETACSGKLT